MDSTIDVWDGAQMINTVLGVLTVALLVGCLVFWFALMWQIVLLIDSLGHRGAGVSEGQSDLIEAEVERGWMRLEASLAEARPLAEALDQIAQSGRFEH